MQATFHERAGVPWQLIAGGVLTALLVALATLQYRWIGEVGEAERTRMRATLQTRVTDFTQAFDHELTQIYLAFHAEPGAADGDPARALAGELARAQASSTVPGLIKDVFMLESHGSGRDVLQRFDPQRGVLEPAAWPKPLEEWRNRATHAVPTGAVGSLPIFLADAVDASVPALVIPTPFVKRIEAGARHIAVLPDPSATPRAVIVWLDAERLRHGLLEPLIAKYFGEADTSEYLVTVVDRERTSVRIYTPSRQAALDDRSAEVSAGFFDLRMSDLTRAAGIATSAPAGSAPPQVAVTIVRRSGAGDAARVLMSGGTNQGAWLLRVRYRSGSLEAIVARSRRWNLAIGAGVLGLLGAAFVLMLAASQRQRRLARQQMEFVASVSHELRTPLAVICSAGENLADGVVADGAQVRNYGKVIETEGRRLGDMVERVMEFAGISSGAAVRARAGVDVAAVIADAVQSVGVEAKARDITVAVAANGALPPITADAGALRSAVLNVVGNAVKYSGNGGHVDVAARATEGGVEIRVADRGRGIDADDMRHVLEPFFRGRRAVEAQIRGTGVGLSVVRQVIARHRGTIAIDNRDGGGTVVTMVLPA